MRGYTGCNDPTILGFSRWLSGCCYVVARLLTGQSKKSPPSNLDDIWSLECSGRAFDPIQPILLSTASKNNKLDHLGK